MFYQQTASKLWRRVGRNMDLLARERAEKLRKMRKAGRAADIDDEEPDLVEVGTRVNRKKQSSQTERWKQEV